MFVCGKIKKLKGEYKKLKTADEFSGLVYIKMDAKGIPTTVFMPCLGKLGDKDSVLKKAMKTLFTNAWANYEIGKSIDENAELAAETAADALADDVEVAEDAPNNEAAPSSEAAPKAEETKKEVAAEDKTAANEALKTLQAAYSFLYPNSQKA